MKTDGLGLLAKRMNKSVGLMQNTNSAGQLFPTGFFPLFFAQLCPSAFRHQLPSSIFLLMHRIAIFASGSGSNAEQLVRHFADRSDVDITLLATNNARAGFFDRRLGVPTLVFDRTTFYQTDRVVMLLQQADIDLVVLAGFLWLIPPALIRAFPGRIINIHPALLPKFGGKGMYGKHVHEAVKAAGETESGITIHLVNEHYDEGRTLFQASCPVLPTDSAKDIGQNVLALEHHHFPLVVDTFLATLPARNQ